jgi:hypothetical protein
MSDQRWQRLVDNELVFRSINEQVKERVENWRELDRAYQRIVCECSNVDCMEHLMLTPQEYRIARRHPDRFLIAPRHDTPEIEDVIYRHDRYWIVRKHPDLV